MKIKGFNYIERIVGESGKVYEERHMVTKDHNAFCAMCRRAHAKERHERGVFEGTWTDPGLGGVYNYPERVHYVYKRVIV